MTRTVSDDAPTGRARQDANGDRLDSWKEIAVYLRRDVKTVQRWERREGLPVHRLHHDKLGSVFAYRGEIDAWVAERHHAPNGNHLGGTAAGAPSGLAAVVHPAELEGNGDAATPGETGFDGGHPWPSRMGDDSDAQKPGRAAHRSRRWGPTLQGLTAGAAALAVAALGWMAVRPAMPRGGAPARVLFLVEPPPGTVFAGTLIDPEPAISPDGSRIVFRAADRNTGRQRLYLRRLDQSFAEALAGTEGGMLAFWSPDSRQVAFFAGGLLRRVDLANRVASSLAPAPHPGGGGWLSTGEIVFNPDEGAGIHVLKAGGGPPMALTAVDGAAGERRHMSPEPSPDGRRFLYLATHDDPARNALWWWSGGPGATHRVVTSRRMGRVAPNGWLLVFRGARLVAQRFDAASGVLSGTSRSLAVALEGDDDNSLHPGFSLSTTGTIAYWPVTRVPTARLTWFDRDGRERGTVGPPGDYPFVSLSPDGRFAAVQRVDEANGAPDLWMIELASSTVTRLTASPVNEEDPVWAPDGGRIVFAKHPAIGADAQLRQLRPMHPLDEDAETFAPGVEGHPTDWSRDGRLVVMQQSSAATQSDVAVWSSASGSPVPLVNTRFNERHGRLSPDGRHLAYSSDVSGRLEVYVRTLDGDAVTTQVSHAGGAHPRWRRDGRELYYLSAGGVVMAVPATSTPRFSAEKALPLFDARPPLPLPFLDTLYDVTADGERFLVAATDQPVTRSFTVVVNALSSLPR